MQKNCREIKISNTIKNILRLIVGFVVVNIMVHTLSESVAIYWHENDAIRQISRHLSTSHCIHVQPRIQMLGKLKLVFDQTGMFRW